MPSITTPGIVLRHANYRDHDRMLTILSPHHGRMDVLSRGCRRPKSALMPASELFVHGEFVCYQQNDHATLSSCAITDTFYPLRMDPYRLTCASYMAALCAASVQAGEEAPQLDAEKLTALVREASGKDDLAVEVKPLANDAIPMMLIEDEQSRRWSDMSRIYGRNELKMPAKYTAVLNSRSKTVQKLSQREKDERSLLLTRQLCDLAELSRQPLEAERMTEFIRRSMEIVNLAAEM